MAVTGSDGGGPLPKKVAADLSIEKVYQKKSQLEHILLRPDTYIGSVEPVTEQMWVFDSDQEMMVQKTITYVPGLYKIFDEILVNAADNKQRDANMDSIKIEINPEDNVISVWNNGQGIPVVEHKDEKMFIPTMIFGHLLTSSNYNDEEEKVTGGRNGYGAKLCNIFSLKFTVETSSKQYKRAFKQTWVNNMSKSSDVKLKDSSAEDYTKITFSPDLSKFKMEKLDPDIVALMSRRAYDVAASSRGVKVFLNGKRLPVKSFKDYVDLYIKNKEDDVGNPLKVIYENVNPRWEVALTTSDKGFQQVSFVNSIATTKGGRHVDYVADSLTKQLIEVIKKKNKGGMQIKPFQIKNHMWIFVNCLIVNPTFDSQTKEHMTLQSKSFGSKCQLSEKFMNSVSKSGLIEQVLTWAKFKQQTQLEKASAGKKKSKLRGIPKLEDANDAGTKNSLSCTLILTEGDSAKTLAVSGLAVVGRDKYGVFPLRGKLLNVREATHKQILENAEISNIIKIMGLQYKKKYETIEDLQTLRYGKLMIMTDQDQDGSHIKGLIVNFIHHNWPSLIKQNFLEVFITPIVKATRGSEEICFYSIPEFDEWRSVTGNWKQYRIKYYKGLGTSTSKEAREYFSNMERHRIKFKYSGPECDQHIIMAFSKKCVEQRKEWLTNWMTERKRRKDLGLPEEYLYTKDTKTITYKDFINKELVLFSNMDIERSIPSLIDGLKPGSRKVLYTCFKRNDKREIKVAQLAGSVAEHSAYHHGEQSLMSTIINLAHNFVGSNNINLLQPIGQFGTRLHGGKDAASPRYIFTMLSPLARLIFHPHDDPLLKSQHEDNQKIEPVWYCPIIPMVLVNGADGIGTGWMTKIPNYNPRDLAANLKKLILGEEDLVTLKPWYKNFKGTIEYLIDGKYIISGEISVINEERVEITELPIGTWTQNYKESVLEPMLNGNEKTPPAITDFKEYHTDTKVKFVISMTQEKLYNAEKEGLHKFFKLQSSYSLSSMCVFDKDNCLKKYETPFEMLKDYYDLRFEYYGKRKDYLVGMLKAEADKLTNQARFIVEKCSNIVIVENKKKGKIIEELINKGYDSDPVKKWSAAQSKDSEEEIDEEAEEADTAKTTDANEPDFNYLLGMSMWSLTLEKKEELLKKKNEKVAELEALQVKTPGDLWCDDLDALLKKLEEVEEEERLNEEIGLNEKGKGKKGLAAQKGLKKKAAMVPEVMPSPVGRRVAPVIDDEMKKKAETAVRLKEKKLKGEVGRSRKERDGEEKDEFDLLEEKNSKGLAKPEKKPRKKKDPSEKSTERKSSSPTKKKKTKPWSDESGDGSFVEDDDIISPQSQPKRQTSRRTAATKVKFNFDSDEDGAFGDSDDDQVSRAVSKVITDNFTSDNDEDSPMKKPTLVKESPAGGASSGSDFDFDDRKGSSVDDSDKLFDSLIKSGESQSKPSSTTVESNSVDIQEKPKAKKPTAPKKSEKSSGEKKPRAAPQKRTKKKDNSDSDSELGSQKAVKKPKKGAKKKFLSDSDSEDEQPTKKKKSLSSDEDFFSESPPQPTRAASGRARKPVSYQFDDDESSD